MNTTVYHGRTCKVVTVIGVPESATHADLLEIAMLAAGETPISHFGTSATRNHQDGTATVTIYTD